MGILLETNPNPRNLEFPFGIFCLRPDMAFGEYLSGKRFIINLFSYGRKRQLFPNHSLRQFAKMSVGVTKLMHTLIIYFLE